MQLIDFALQGLQEKAHQPTDFLWWPLPIFAAEGKPREIGNTALRRSLDGLTHRLDAGPMAGMPW
jgi:hypothetical protein